MNVVVFGAGATGTLFGARLAQAGHGVLLVGRPAHVAAVRSKGVVVENRVREVVRVEAVTDLPPGTETAAVLLTVKAFDLTEAAASLARSLRHPAPLLLPQNGLAIEEGAREGLLRGGWREPDVWMVRAVHSVPATWVRPGVVRAAGEGEVLLPSPRRGEGPPSAVETFRVLFASAGFQVRQVREFDREVWRKALVNAAINPLTAVRGVPNGSLLTEPLRSEAVALLREAVRAARAAGFPFSEEEAEADFARVARATAQNRSSMLQDLDRGRPTEVEAISGEFLRIAAEHGFELPATRAVVDEVRRRAARAAGRAQPS